MDFDPKKYDSLMSSPSRQLADLIRNVSISVPTAGLSSLAKTAISNMVMPKIDTSGITRSLAEIRKVYLSDDFRQSIQATLAARTETVSALSSLATELTRVSLPSTDFLRDAALSIADTVQSFRPAQIFEPLDADITPEDVADTIEQALPYVSESDIGTECKEQISELRKAPHAKWTLVQLSSILGLLITLLTFIYQVLPNKQLDAIIELQKETITEIRSEKQALQTENQALVDTLCSLGDTINALREEVEALREQPEGVNDSIDPQSEQDASESQNDDADPQN